MGIAPDLTQEKLGLTPMVPCGTNVSMIERITRTNSTGVGSDLLYCMCEAADCGWAWVTPYSGGEPKRCSRCKRRSWNGPLKWEEIKGGVEKISKPEPPQSVVPEGTVRREEGWHGKSCLCKKCYGRRRS